MLGDYSHKIVRTRVSDPKECGRVLCFHSIPLNTAGTICILTTKIGVFKVSICLKGSFNKHFFIYKNCSIIYKLVEKQKSFKNL